MTPWENLLRAYRFQGPEQIPASCGILPAAWAHYGRELEEVVLRHPALFPNHRKGSIDFENFPFAPFQRADEPFTDDWGCVWRTALSGITGTVVEHPLADWDAFDSFVPPDPEKTNGRAPLDWPRIGERFARAREQGLPLRGSLLHGHGFLQLTYLRGFENLLFDMVDGEPRLERLIEKAGDFSLHVVRRYLDAGAEVMGYPEDLGAQNTPLISPALFRKYITPLYKRLMTPAREKGCVVHMHCDGHVWDLVDDLLDSGVEVLNIQDLVHGIDNLASDLKGRVCIDLDIDRQDVTVHGSPKDVDDLIREEVAKLADPRGGLCLCHGAGPAEPLENIDAVMTALEKYSTFPPG
jgi:uroporphyrinogen decarboxylase